MSLFITNNKTEKKEIHLVNNINEFINKTVFLISNKNIVFFDYTVFKQISCPENYNEILNNIFTNINRSIYNYTNFEFHINLNTFSITAIDKYKDIIEMFCNTCNKNYTNLINKLVVYNTPLMIDKISYLLTPFIHSNIRNKIILIDKKSSQKKMDELFSENNSML